MKTMNNAMQGKIFVFIYSSNNIFMSLQNKNIHHCKCFNKTNWSLNLIVNINNIQRLLVYENSCFYFEQNNYPWYHFSFIAQSCLYFFCLLKTLWKPVFFTGGQELSLWGIFWYKLAVCQRFIQKCFFNIANLKTQFSLKGLKLMISFLWINLNKTFEVKKKSLSNTNEITSNSFIL